MTWAIFSDEHVRAIGEIIQTRSERIVAIVGGALLDDTLRRTLAERLRNDKDISKKLLRINGPLGNPGPKIDLLYMLHAFERPVRNSLYGLTRARNFFAHNLDASFNSQKKEMAEAMKSLVLHEDLKVYPHHNYEGNTNTPVETVTKNRDRFLVNLKLCLIALMRDRLSHDKWSNKPLTKMALHKKKQMFKQLERTRRAAKKP